MSTPHVFVVDDRSFPIHLQYQFAGTTPGRATLRRHIGLLCDIGRVRAGDPVIFYVLRAGFCGIFRISKTKPQAIWEPDSPGYLEDALGKHLIYRVFIEPEKVYPKPVLEWEAINNLPTYAKDVRWSLFYRKMKAERGCSYLFPQEYEGLVRLLEEVNQGTALEVSSDESLTWDVSVKEIKKLNRQPEPYNGQLRTPPNPLVEAAHLIRRGQQFESYLQGYFTLNIDRDPALAQVCGSAPRLRWFANEVFSGSSMQKIDIFTILQNDSEQEFRIVELKSTQASASDIGQLAKYVRWAKVYVHGADNKSVQPILFGHSAGQLAPINSAMREYDVMREAKPIKYFEFDVSGDKLIIQSKKIKY